MKHMQRYLVLSGSDFEVFRPIGVTRCTYGVTFDMEGSIEVLHAKYHHHQCRGGKMEPEKNPENLTKFLPNFAI